MSIHSVHRREAIELVRFQLRALMRAAETNHGSVGAAQPVSLEASNPRTSIVARPSIAAGSKYKMVSTAYFEAVHAVLTGQKGAPEAAADLEKRLIEITGFHASGRRIL